MCEILCVTNRRLCQADFLTRVAQIARCGVSGIVLREKDLPEADYRALAKRVLSICDREGIPCILHRFVAVALSLDCDRIHLPLARFRELRASEKARFSVIGVSVHAPEEALEAQALGATYLTAGHVFATDCKRGVPPRGLPFLRSVCAAVQIPVYAIGGVNPTNLPDIAQTGTRGACIMSGFMTCEEVAAFAAGLGLSNSV